MSVMTVTDVMKLIPNRFPILYIDRVEELIPGEHVVATKNVTYNEHVFQGHFPGEPVLPGVLVATVSAMISFVGTSATGFSSIVSTTCLEPLTG